jgi:hypothetical protein
LDEALVEQQRLAYAVPGVDDTEDATAEMRKRKKANGDVRRNGPQIFKLGFLGATKKTDFLVARIQVLARQSARSQNNPNPSERTLPSTFPVFRSTSPSRRSPKSSPDAESSPKRLTPVVLG